MAVEQGASGFESPVQGQRPVLRWLLVGATAVVLVALGFLAGRMTLLPPPTTPEVTDDMITVEVVERTIGQTLDYGGRTARAVQPVATNSLSGVVTFVSDKAVADRKVGDVLYAVDGVAVRVIEGKLPFYRALSEGVTGEDVTQLEAALVELGHLTAADSTFDAATTQAVSAWQRTLGSPVTGTIGVGELVASPTLPASMSVDTKVAWKGAVLSGGEVIVSVGTGDPSFTLPLSPGQLNLVPQDAPMTVEGFGQSWPARWESSAQDQDLGVGEIVTLGSPVGGPVCADSCDMVPAEPSWVTVRIEVVPRTTGPAVPVSAISTDATGQAWVTVVHGETRETRKVTVERSHGGLAVVDGVNAGESVQALASQSEPTNPGVAASPGQDDQPTGSPDASPVSEPSETP